MTIRLTGTEAEINLAVHRLRSAFHTVTAGEPEPSATDPGELQVDVTTTF